ncbi:MAG: class I SAM-dependent methyltransferase, partial [Candidatus Heimdallarchaeaceae archaeon]
MKRSKNRTKGLVLGYSDFTEYSKDAKVEDSLDLEIFVKVLGLNSLHLGIWKQGQPVTMDELPKAQKNYTVKLVGMFPEEAKSVLDVGAGVGDNAIYMSEEGMEVICISPSPSQEAYFSENILPEYENVAFIRSRFEDLEIDKKFDVVLMSESSNYFPMEYGLDQTIRYLKDGGYLVMGAHFRKDSREDFKEMHIHKTYVENAKKRGLTLIEDIDVTEQVIPTVEIMHNVFKYAPSLVDVLVDFYEKSFRKKYKIISKLASKFFKKEIEILEELLLNVGPRRTDP